jgi:N-carbamoyl-L-amino-acid hydrolase
MALAEIGATPSGGVCRLALTDEEIAARRLLIDWAEALGLTVFTDDIGNLFFRLSGSDPEAAPIVTGSHIDTQPTGGKFDGAYGVVAGFEAVEAILDAGITTARPIEVVAWVNEEGSRFSPGMMGSEAFTSRRPIAQILEVADADGTTTAEALDAVLAAFPSLERRGFGMPIAAFIEAHIEQGPVLEREGVPVGVVTGIQGSRRFRVEVDGEAAHAGTQPMAKRKDALLAALRIIDALRAAFEPDDAKFTVGLFDLSPNVPSVVPSRAYFSIDLRHPDQATLVRLGDVIAAACDDHAAPCSAGVTEIATSESLEFPESIRATIAAAADTLDIPAIPLLSLAGHDARQLHYYCPTGMIFTPCKDGVSHNEAESATPSDLAAGTRVLAATLAQLASEA